MDVEKLRQQLSLKPGEKLTIDINGTRYDITSDGIKAESRISKTDALSQTLAAAQTCRDIRDLLTYQYPDAVQIKKFAGDLIEAGELLQRYADQ